MQPKFTEDLVVADKALSAHKFIRTLRELNVIVHCKRATRDTARIPMAAPRARPLVRRQAECSIMPSQI